MTVSRQSSANPFIESIPATWQEKQLRRVALAKASNVDKKSVEGEVTVSLCNYVDVYYNDSIDSRLDFMEATATTDQIATFTLRQGDVLITKDSETPDDIAVPAHVVEDMDGVLCGYHLSHIRPSTELSGAFLAYCFRAKGIRDHFYCNATGVTRFGLSRSDIGTCPVPLPPFEMQRTIAAYLDRETAKIDLLIAKKRELIEKLKEQRSALISRAVTRGLPPAAAKAAGLNPNPPMKDSGVAWLGEVPEHWGISRIKMIAKVGNGSTPSRDEPAYWDDQGFPWLNSSVVNQEVVSDSDQYVTERALRECHLPKVTPPAVLVGITGEGRTRGMASTLVIEATINQHLAFVKPFPTRANVDYVRRIFDACYQYLRSESGGGGSTKGAITCEQIAALGVAIPPLSEQLAIVSFLDASLARLAKTHTLVESAIARLTEYRAALITAAVTGQIEVAA